MNLLKKLKSQTGLSLLEVTIAGALLVGLSLMVSKLSKTGQKSVQKVKTDFEFENLKDYVSGTLGNPEHCFTTFAGLDMKDPDPPQTMQSGGAIPAPTVLPTSMQNLMNAPTPTNDPGNPRFYEIGSAATLGYAPSAANWAIRRNDGDGAPYLDHIALTADQTIPGFPNWTLVRARFYQVFANDVNEDNGVCPVYIEVERQLGANSKRSFGGARKAFWVDISCKFNPTSPNPNEISACSRMGQESDSYWRLVNDNAPEGGIIHDFDVTVGQHLIVESDERLKKSFNKIENSSEKLQDITGLYYFMRAEEFPQKYYDKERKIGLVAQEVEKVFPEAVVTNPNTGIKAVRYSMFIPILIEAHKEQELRIKKQEKQIQELQKLVKTLLGKD